VVVAVDVVCDATSRVVECCVFVQSHLPFFQFPEPALDEGLRLRVAVTAAAVADCELGEPGAEGLLFPYYGFGADATHPNEGLSQCFACASEAVITPHASFLALDAAQAYANIQALRSHYPGVYGVDGFFDAVNPTTGAVGHCYLVLDQSMIMAALDNALANRAIQRDFAADPVSWAAHTYLGLGKDVASITTPVVVVGGRSPTDCIGRALREKPW
jgi:Putative glucoamylase